MKIIRNQRKTTADPTAVQADRSVWRTALYGVGRGINTRRSSAGRQGRPFGRGGVRASHSSSSLSTL